MTGVLMRRGTLDTETDTERKDDVEIHREKTIMDL